MVKDGAGILDGFDEGVGIGGARADVEAYADNVQLELLRNFEQFPRGVQRCAKLEAKAAKARRVVRGNAEEQLGIRAELLDLVELVDIVECHLLHASRRGVAQVRLGLAWLEEDMSAPDRGK